MYAYNPMTGMSPAKADLDRAFFDAMERYGVTHVNRTMFGGFSVQFPDGVLGIQVLGVDQPYGVMHRISLERGAWFAERDALRLAPAVVVSEEVWERLGSPDLRVDQTMGIVTPT